MIEIAVDQGIIDIPFRAILYIPFRAILLKSVVEKFSSKREVGMENDPKRVGCVG